MLIIKLIKTNISRVKFYGKQNQNLFQKNLIKIITPSKVNSIKVNSIENKENEVDMEVSSQIEAKDEKASKSYYLKGNAEPITKTDVYKEVRTRFWLQLISVF